MPDRYSTAASDNYRLARSKLMIEPADGSYNIIHLPRFTFVKKVWVRIDTAYGDAGATMTVGFIGNGESADPDAFMTSTECDPDATGMKTSVGGTADEAEGKWFDTARGAITVDVDDNGGTVGTFTVFVEYTVLK